jgi:Flp pilus assembly protein TadB
MVLIVTALVVSHWVLDWITHRPDMPLYPGSIKLGLGLWNSIPATIAVEVTMFAAGVWMYARATRAGDASGRWAFAAFVGLLLVIYFANIGSAPPSITAVVIVGIAGTVVLILWAWWFDRHRTALI